MRHLKKFNHLGRKKKHREAMLANMANSLILEKRITTTTAKAKALRSYVEPLITKSKEDSTSSRRTAFKYLQNKEAVSELFREVAKKVGDRPGGYTRIIKLSDNRLGDNAEMAMIELVDYNETMLSYKEDSKKKSTRRRRGGKKKSSEVEQQAKQETAKPETKADKAEEVKAPKEEKTPEAKAEKAPEAIKEEPKAEEKATGTEKEEGAEKKDDKKSE